MTICELALLRYARQRMTPAELETAQRTADRADAGEPGYKDVLMKLVYEVVYDRSRVDAVEPMPPMTARVIE